MNKVMLISPRFYGMTEMMVNSLIRNNCEVKYLEYSRGIEKKKYLLRIKMKLGLDISKNTDESRKKFSLKAIELFDSFNPDVVLVFLGLQLTADAIEYMNKSAVTIVHLTDMISLFPKLYDFIPHYQIIFSYDKADVDDLNNKGYNAIWLKASYDPMVYHLTDSVEPRDIDVAFVGAMYPERKEALKKLVKDYPNIRWAIYGEYAKPRHGLEFIKFIFSPEKKYFQNKKLAPDDVNALYNRSKIVLNIVRSNQRMGWSSRLPQILSTGALQITNYFPEVEKEFGHCLKMYHNYEEMKAIIGYYLDHDDERDKISQEGINKVVEFTSDEGIAYLLNEYNKYMNKKAIK